MSLRFSLMAGNYASFQYNSLLSLDYTKYMKVIAFADDLIVITKGTSILEAENFANIEMQKIHMWAMNNKTRFNEHKSKTMLITRRKRKENKDIRIFLNNKQLEQVNKMKYLGIIIDTKFCFNYHIDYVTERCTKLINVLSRTAKINWRLKHEALRTIYKGAILPLLSYGAPVWINALDRSYNLKKLKQVQRLINKLIAKAYRTTSHEVLCVLTGFTSIQIKIEEIMRTYLVKRSNKYQFQNADHARGYKNWIHPAEFTKINETMEKTECTYKIYIDGSKSELGIGSGVAIFNNEELTYQLKFKLYEACSNNQAEQLAILKALEYVKDLNNGEVSVDERKVAI